MNEQHVKGCSSRNHVESTIINADKDCKLGLCGNSDSRIARTALRYSLDVSVSRLTSPNTVESRYLGHTTEPANSTALSKDKKCTLRI